MVNTIIDKLRRFNPKSIFVYGSRAINSVNSKSDFELGIIFDEENYVHSSAIREIIDNAEFSVYSFKYRELTKYDIDTPFEKNLYIYSLICGGAKTIYGEKIIENLVPLKICVENLISDVYFNLGYALSAYRVSKTGNFELATEMLYKSFFFVVRDLIFFKTNKFVNGYNNIYKSAQQIEIPKEYKELFNKAYELRNEKCVQCDSSYYFQNISFINKYVIPMFEKNNKM